METIQIGLNNSLLDAANEIILIFAFDMVVY